MARILLIEDEPALRQALRDAFEYHGYSVLDAVNGLTGIRLVEAERPDLVILDIMLPDIDGFEVCLRLRAGGFSKPIIMLTARSEEVDRVVGLEVGADDYVIKPFSTRELIARVKAHLRRDTQDYTPEANLIETGEATIDLPGSSVSRDGTTIPLTSSELIIIKLLINRKNEVVSREQIMHAVWGYESYPESRAVDTHILNLRNKIEKDRRKPEHIVTVHGLGYKWVE
jgi:DNA-binding response OmpR family regulator